MSTDHVKSRLRQLAPYDDDYENLIQADHVYLVQHNNDHLVDEWLHRIPRETYQYRWLLRGDSSGPNYRIHDQNNCTDYRRGYLVSVHDDQHLSFLHELLMATMQYGFCVENLGLRKQIQGERETIFNNLFSEAA